MSYRMSRRLRVAFVHDWPVHFEQEYTWRDGLAAAVKILSERHELKFWGEGPKAVIPHPYFPIHVSPNIPEEVKEFDPDVIISWGDCTRPNAEALSKLGKPMALCFAGGEPFGSTHQFYDHFFVESKVYKDAFEARGFSVSTAFGTNTALFTPLPNQQKVFDAIFPATFADWKRHDLYSKATKGLTACAVGFMYHDHEQYCWEACEKAGNLVLPHVSAEALQRLFAASRACVITSRSGGGSQRTVLEAMAMNIPVIVTEDSDKSSEYAQEARTPMVAPDPEAIRKAIEEWKDKPVTTREYILSKWSETHYADALDAWIQSVV